MFSMRLLKVCERSLSGSGAGPNAASASQFVRAEMLSSGYLIRPCDGGGSIIHIVDHLNLEVIGSSQRTFCGCFLKFPKELISNLPSCFVGLECSGCASTPL